jgi:GntR family transcriptional regulator
VDAKPTKKNEPIYLQIKHVLIEKIKNGAFPDKKLPPVRQVAKDYTVSVNTVLKAYEELQKEGIVSGSVGRGTFVTTNPQELLKQNRESLVKSLIKHTLEKALALGFTIEDFEQSVTEFVREQKEIFSHITIAFIECNIEQLIYFANHLELDPSIHHIPVLLSDFIENIVQTSKKINDCDMVITSFYHLSEVKSFLVNYDKPIIGINLEPEMSTIVEIAKVVPDSVIGIVTTSTRFLNIVKDILSDLDLKFREVLETNSDDEETIHRLVQKCDTVLVSPKRKKVVEKYVKPTTKVIEFVFTPDRTSISNIKVAILELKKNQI